MGEYTGVEPGAVGQLHDRVDAGERRACRRGWHRVPLSGVRIHASVDRRVVWEHVVCQDDGGQAVHGNWWDCDGSAQAVAIRPWPPPTWRYPRLRRHPSRGEAPGGCRTRDGVVFTAPTWVPECPLPRRCISQISHLIGTDGVTDCFLGHGGGPYRGFPAVAGTTEVLG